MASPRGTRLPQKLRTQILAVGDIHLDLAERIARSTKARDDLNRMIGSSSLAAVVQLGDQTTYATTDEFNTYYSWRAGITAAGEYGEIPGNHDLIGNNASGGTDIFTPSQWAELVRGLEAPKDVVIDLPGVRLLLVSPAQDASTGEAHVRRLTLDPATLAWCDARIGETASKCLLFFHAPLPDTVGPLDGSAFSSYDERWRAHWDTAYPISDMIADHPNLIAWVSGHTHSRYFEEDAVKKMTYGDVSIACISASSPAFLNPSLGYVRDSICSALITITDTGVEVRYRDHGAGQWLEPVHTITL